MSLWEARIPFVSIFFLFWVLQSLISLHLCLVVLCFTNMHVIFLFNTVAKPTRKYQPFILSIFLAQ